MTAPAETGHACRGFRWSRSAVYRCHRIDATPYRTGCEHEHVGTTWLCPDCASHPARCADCFLHPSQPHSCWLRIQPAERVS